ncbi:hypothetical protein RMATCC62417_00345 [Rhizopus microsporus]|nr:hypothetical protein RMATCC62417_00345 [Rhizopus microsporus]
MTSQVISVTASSSPLTKTTSFITSLISSNTQKSQPLSLKQNDRKWRWWNILSVAILLLVLFEIIILCTSYSILSSEKPLVTIVKRQYPTMKYTHLDTDIQSKIEKDTRVYHVTKEFGPAAISDLGRYVTGLATAQQASELTDVAVVMPLYPFMRRLAPTLEIEMMIEMRGKHPGEKAALEFRVYKAMYAFNPPLQAPAKRVWQMINNVNTSVNLTPQREPAKRDAIPVYMISQANKFPFNKAFKHRTPEEINDEHPDLPNDWQDQYFAKAATAFLAYKANAADEESIFAPIRVVPRVDIVHIHGASNAYVAKFLQDKKEADDLGPRPPAIVYTVHDHQAEMKYCNSFRSVRKFLDHPGDREKLHKYVYGGRMFMSKVAIDHAEAVTFVDHALAADVLEGRRDFHLKELVMDSLLRKAQGSRFFGINQAIDYHSTDHPFITDKLANKSMAYPKYALDMIHDQPSLQSVDPSQPLTLVVPETPTYWTLPELSKNFVSVYKDRARRYLIRRSLLKEADMRRPVVLFRGALAYNAGVESLAYAAQLFAEQNMKLIIMGSRADYPFEEIKAIETRYPEHIKVVSDVKDMRRYGTLCRAAADFVFVPTVHEDDLGLQTVGGLVYGSAVISTGAGRLHAALIDRGDVRGNVHVDYPDSTKTENGATVTSYEYYNAYLYNHTSKDSLKQAISDAASDYNQLIRNNKALREEFILRMIRTAISLAWDKGHFQGPMHEYNQVYQLVLQDRLIPRMRMHEVEQEDELVSRLRDSTDDPFKWN